MDDKIKKILDEKYTYKLNGWNFKIANYHEIQKSFRILADNEEITEAMLVDHNYIDNKEDFIKECTRFYVNRLDSLD